MHTPAKPAKPFVWVPLLALLLIVAVAWLPFSHVAAATATSTPTATSTASATTTATLTATPTLTQTASPTPTTTVPGSTPVVTGSITVTGSAQVMVIPDEVVFTLGVETNDLDVTKAKQQNDEIIKQVLVLTQKYAIDPKFVQTDYISIEPRYNSGIETPANFLGYFVRKTVVVHLSDISKFEPFYTDVLAAGVNNIQGIEFRTTDLRTYRDQARDLAIKAAREKAVALSAAVGQTIGQVKTITEEQNNYWSSYNYWWGSSSAAMAQNVIQNSPSSGSFTDEETLAPGQIAVSASVSVEFELLK